MSAEEKCRLYVNCKKYFDGANVEMPKKCFDEKKAVETCGLRKRG